MFTCTGLEDTVVSKDMKMIGGAEQPGCHGWKKQSNEPGSPSGGMVTSPGAETGASGLVENWDPADSSESGATGPLLVISMRPRVLAVAGNACASVNVICPFA